MTFSIWWQNFAFTLSFALPFCITICPGIYAAIRLGIRHGKRDKIESVESLKEYERKRA